MKKFLVGCIAVLMTFMLSSCTAISLLFSIIDMFNQQDISLEYTLTQDDLTEFTEIVEECETLAMSGTSIMAINGAFSEMLEKLEYIETQQYVGYLEYCLDQTNETAIAHYTESEEIMASARTQYIAMLKKIAKESPIKDELFAGWSEEEMAMLFIDHEKISSLQLANSEITRDFYALEEDEKWSDTVNVLYEDLVANNQLMAQEYGYENYYELASDMIYSRKYTAEQRASFREYVAEYVVPLYADVHADAIAAYEALTETQKTQYAALYSDSELLNGYIDSFEYSMNEKMNAMFERPNAAIFAENENALQGAFTAYMAYYEQPFAYFGPNYQDVFTMVHEMGHYVSYYYFEDSVLPYDLAETHSQGNEWLFIAYLEDKVDPKVYEALYLDRALTGLVSVIYSTLVDHFEERVYTSEIPIKADGFEAVMSYVCSQYEGIKEVFGEETRYTPFEYAQHVTLPHPGYYLNYATSELASMGVYVLAQEKGYEQAQAAYTLLQEGVDPTADFTTAIAEAGLLSPFAEQTYLDLKKVFVTE